jgi:hypothetical protein
MSQSQSEVKEHIATEHRLTSIEVRLTAMEAMLSEVYKNTKDYAVICNTVNRHERYFKGFGMVALAATGKILWGAVAKIFGGQVLR